MPRVSHPRRHELRLLFPSCGPATNPLPLAGDRVPTADGHTLTGYSNDVFARREIRILFLAGVANNIAYYDNDLNVGFI